MKKIYKSNEKVINGVCSGIGIYLGFDPVLIRILFLVFLLFNLGFYPIIAYLIMSSILPSESNIIDIEN